MTHDPLAGFDPGAAADPAAGIFGLPHARDRARIVLIPVPFDATTSYRAGTAKGPDAIRRASLQVDLYDRRFGRVYEHGIHMESAVDGIAQRNARARALAAPIIARGGALDRDAQDVDQVDRACRWVADRVAERVTAALDEQKIPGVVGGEHGVSFGAIRACALHHTQDGHPLGLLQIDAHMDLRPAFEGFARSHASIIHNVIHEIPEVTSIVQVGVRDFSEEEMDLGIEAGARVRTHFDDAWADRAARGEALADLVAEAIDELPDRVYVTFDIDGLDPALCPNTGTPVPGGLSFATACLLLETLRASGRTIVGFDLVEVAPSPDASAPEWDANVGARVLYKLCGAAARA